MASSLQAVSQPQVKWLKQMGTAVWCEVCLRMNFGNSHMYDRMTAPQKLARVSSSSSSSSQHTNFIFSIHTMSRDCCAFTPCPYTLWIKNCRTIYFCCNLYVYLNVDRFSKFFHTILLQCGMLTIQYAARSARLYLIHGSLGQPESSTRTASWSLQPYLQDSLVWQTDRPRYSVGPIGRIYVSSTAMRSNNNCSISRLLDWFLDIR